MSDAAKLEGAGAGPEATGGHQLPDLARLESAEAFFEALDVPYDPHVLAVARLHVLRRFGAARAAIDDTPGLSTAEVRARYRVALAEAHALFERESPRAAGSFGCFRDRAPLVALRPPRRDGAAAAQAAPPLAPRGAPRSAPTGRPEATTPPRPRPSPSRAGGGSRSGS